MQLSSTYMKKGIKNIPSASILLKSTQILSVESYHHKTGTSSPYSVKNIRITDNSGIEKEVGDITAATFLKSNVDG